MLQSEHVSKLIMIPGIITTASNPKVTLVWEFASMIAQLNLKLVVNEWQVIGAIVILARDSSH